MGATSLYLDAAVRRCFSAFPVVAVIDGGRDRGAYRRLVQDLAVPGGWCLLSRLVAVRAPSRPRAGPYQRRSRWITNRYIDWNTYRLGEPRADAAG